MAAPTGYATAHARVKRARGFAYVHTCIWCGLTAEHWAYQWAGPEEVSADGFTWSTAPEAYEPMCARCHRAFDKAHRRGQDSAPLRSAAYARVSDEQREAAAKGAATNLRALESFLASGPPSRKGLPEQGVGLFVWATRPAVGEAFDGPALCAAFRAGCSAPELRNISCQAFYRAAEAHGYVRSKRGRTVVLTYRGR